MKNFWYLFAGYTVIWALIFFYVQRLNSKIKELSLKLDRLSQDK
ncbi:MAG: hypothetical protein PWQ25_55 [Deferribacteres bacterium]|jgi:CcmD family protein|nr:hypothetical protein [Deferribacteraceae bacterium]MDK2791192.1 hypothetical protein [Deferribacteres bacterium]